MTSPKTFLRTLLCLLALAPTLNAANQTSPANTDADQVYREATAALNHQSYAKAEELYRQLLAAETPSQGVSRDELIYLQANAEWRNLASTRQSDPEVIEAPRERLAELAKALKKNAQGGRPPELWAEAQESIGDSYWLPEQFRNWNQAWPHYQQALDWWAGSTSLNDARERYLAIVFRAAQPPSAGPYWRYGNRYGNWIPYPVLRNALELARSPDQKALANYLLAQQAQRNWQQYAFEVGPYFQAAINEGKATDWRDDALFQYAQWAQRFGGSEYDDNGNLRAQPDFELAVKLYRQLLDEYDQGESRYHDQAERALANITEPSLTVAIHRTFLPKTAVDFNLQWRNLEQVTVEIFSVDLTTDFDPGDTYNPLNLRGDESKVKVDGREPLRRIVKDSNGKPYTVQRGAIQLDDGLPAGAYLIHAHAGSQSTKELLFVSQYAITLLRDDETVLAWVTDAITSQPMPDAKVKLWLGTDPSSGGQKPNEWLTASKETDEDGLARFSQTDFETPDKQRIENYSAMVAVTNAGDQPAAAQQNFFFHKQNDDWKVYAFTNRPAYRPGDEIHWKATARARVGASAWSTPTGEKLHFRITGPHGEEIAKGVKPLNDYGSTWDSLTASKDWALGMYRIEFRRDREDGEYIGGAELFRLEEYKLPEFKVNVSPSNPGGETVTAYRLGDTVSVAVAADYYFGGAVTNAEVEVIVRESPFYHYWQPPTPYPWLRRDNQSTRYYGGNGKEVLRETLKTDAEGRAHFTIETNAGSRQDLRYSIEARVVDESRREVTGRAEIKATRQPYFVYLTPARTLYRPGETAELTINTRNANDDPVAVEGRVRLTREEWMEVYRGPGSEEISGEEYRRRVKSTGLFSKALNPNDWTLIRQGYDVEEIKTTTIQTGDDGEAVYSFKVPKAGYYRVYWVSRPDRSAPIKRDAAVWVADNASLDIGYHGELSIVTDESAFREGKNAPAMITTPDPGRWVLVSVQGGGLLDFQVIEMEGNVRLVNYAVTDSWLPNVTLQADMTADLRAHQDRKEIIIPAEKNFIDVSIATNAKDYLPRETGQVTITTRDTDGNPIPAEVALTVFDEAVLAIQPSLAPDPRQFFYGDLRPEGVHTSTSFQFRAFAQPEIEERVVMNESRRIGNAFGGDMIASSVFRESNDMDPFASSIETPAPMALEAASVAARQIKRRSGMEMDGAKSAEPAVVVRSDFRAAAFWEPAIITNGAGKATVDVTFPDSLTSWNLEARAVGLPAKFGEGDASARTRLPLIARLQTPRFLVTTDEVTLSGVVTNNSDQDIKAEVTLAIDGGLKLSNSATQSITVPANASARADWTLSAQTPGPAKVTLTAKSSAHADAMELTIPVFEHGIEKFIANSGKMTTDQLDFAITIPEFRAEGATFDLYLTPSIAVTMLDALPYLAQYPYGCTEQTMSRFLPAVVVADTLKNLGLDASQIVNQSFGGIEEDTPESIKSPNANRKEGDGDLGQLDSMVTAGLSRLTDSQQTSGGWGWWKSGSPDSYMSAYVTWGLTLAQQAGREIDSAMLNRARDYLGKELVNFETEFDMQAWLLHALASARRDDPNAKPDKLEARAFANLWKNRDQLNAFTRALTALSAHWLGFEEEAAILVENLANGAIIDNDPQGSTLIANSATQSNAAILPTAHWGDDGIFYRWSRGGVESTAFVLMALAEIAPDSELVEPAMNWLVKNRRGAQWSNTRDTAIVVLALNSWLRSSGELNASGEYEALVNGEPVGSISIAPDSVFSAPRKISVPVQSLTPGETKITLQRKAGGSPIYFSARFNFFSLEDPVTPAGNELFVKRDYQRTTPIKTLLNGYRLNTSDFADGDTVQSGDRIEAAVLLQAKNDLEYLLIEDLKPAGFEAVALQSGAQLYAREVRPGSLDSEDRYTGRQRWVYQELRDRQIATFIDALPQGIWEITYELRAETPGNFSALPVIAEAMYVPEIRGNSAEIKVKVRDQER